MRSSSDAVERMRSLSNVWKSAVVKTGEPILLRDNSATVPPGGTSNVQRAAWLCREREIRAQAQRAYLHAKAQGLRAGEDTGRRQGEQDAAQQLERLRAKAHALLQEERGKQVQALAAADEECLQKAEAFAQALAEKIFGQAVHAPLMTEDEQNPPASAAPPVAGREYLEQREDERNALPALDPQEIERAAQMVFSSGSPVEPDNLLFTDLLDIPARLLQKVLKSVKIRDLAVALKGIDTDSCTALLETLPKRLRETARQELEFLGPVPLSQTELAQKHILQVVRRLQKREQASA